MVTVGHLYLAPDQPDYGSAQGTGGELLARQPITKGTHVHKPESWSEPTGGKEGEREPGPRSIKPVS
jgi:hypothetical protein